MFSLYKNLCKTHGPGRAHFYPQGHNLNKLGRGPLNTKAPSLAVSDKKMFYHVSLYKHK